MLRNWTQRRGAPEPRTGRISRRRDGSGSLAHPLCDTGPIQDFRGFRDQFRDTHHLQSRRWWASQGVQPVRWAWTPTARYCAIVSYSRLCTWRRS